MVGEKKKAEQVRNNINVALSNLVSPVREAATSLTYTLFLPSQLLKSCLLLQPLSDEMQVQKFIHF